MKGRRLDKLPSTMTTWGKWRALYPQTTVYVKTSIPYNARFDSDHFSRIAKKDPDGPLEATDWVVGLEWHVEAAVYPAKRLAGMRLLNEHFEGQATLVYLSEDLSTPLVSTYSLWFAWQKYRPDSEVWGGG